MQLTAFNAKTDVQLGDEVKFIQTQEVVEIHDIAAVHSLRTKSVHFQYQFKTKNGEIFTVWTNDMPKQWFLRREFKYPIRGSSSGA